MSLDFAFSKIPFSLPSVLAVEEVNLIRSFNHLAESLLLETAILFKIVIESIALLILALAIIKAVKGLLWRNYRIEREEKLSQVRLDLGKALARHDLVISY